MAPAAALLAVTAAVLAVHYGLQQKEAPAPAATVTHTARERPHRPRAAVFARTYVVQRGDSLFTIAVKAHTTVARLERLNPDVSPTALRVGQQIAVK